MAVVQRRSSLTFVVLMMTLLGYSLVLPGTTASSSSGNAMEKTDAHDYNPSSIGGNVLFNPRSAGVGAGGNGGAGSKRNLRSIYGFGPKMLQISRSKIPIELDLLVDNEDNDRSKRFDDYGHMRFGKRGGEEQFDDYGHMRFGRST